MMHNISYVFPNISEFNRNGRGGLYKRYKFASTANCKFIEVPADFIKNKTEVNKTGKKLGTILSISDINQLYEPGTPSKKLKYIMHSEPSLQRRDGAGSSFTPPLRWYDRKWTNDFIRMLTDITEQLTIPPAGVEIHPGGKKNTYEDLIKAITAIRVQFKDTSSTLYHLSWLKTAQGSSFQTGNKFANFGKGFYP